MTPPPFLPRMACPYGSERALPYSGLLLPSLLGGLAGRQQWVLIQEHTGP